jgi:hypothetical protein
VGRLNVGLFNELFESAFFDIDDKTCNKPVTKNIMVDIWGSE